MNFIILDLEWDSAYIVKYHRFLNQILQIGAVKLDENFNIIDTFDVIIKSDFAKRVTGRFAKLTGITTEKMRAGIPFADAVKQYNDWVGEDTVTMTYSNSDLFTIGENEELLLNGVKFKIEKYLDFQKFIEGEIRLKGIELTNQISLSAAAEILGVSTEKFMLHTAKDDSLVCAELLKKYYNAERFLPLIRDTSDPEFYKRLHFKPFAISDIKSKAIDRKKLEFNCDICGRRAKRVSKWKYKNRWFCADFYCKNCDRKFNGRASFKQTYDTVISKTKICEIKVKEKEQAVKNEVQSMSE